MSHPSHSKSSLTCRRKIVHRKLFCKVGFRGLRVNLSRFKIFMQLIWWILRQLSRSTIPLVPETFQARFPIFLSSLYSDLHENLIAASAEDASTRGRPRNISAARERKPQVPRVSGWLHSPIYIRRRFAPRNLASYPPLFTFPSGFCCVVYIALHREGKPVPLKVPMNIQSTRDNTRKIT